MSIEPVTRCLSIEDEVNLHLNVNWNAILVEHLDVVFSTGITTWCFADLVETVRQGDANDRSISPHLNRTLCTRKDRSLLQAESILTTSTVDAEHLVVGQWDILIRIITTGYQHSAQEQDADQA